MKTLLLPVLLWTLAISPIFAQHQLSPETHFYVTELPQQSQRLLALAGLLDEHGEPASQIQNRAADLRLDSTAVFNNYSATDSSQQLLTWNMYPQDNVTVNIDFEWDTDHWIIVNRTTTIRDELDRITEVIAHRWDATIQNYVFESRLEVFPRGTSQTLVDSFFVSTWQTDTWSREFSTWNQYDNTNRILESESEFVFFGESLNLLDKYLYVNNRLDKVETYQVFEGEEMLGSVQFYLYQNDKLWVTMTHVAAGIGELVPETREEYIYDENDRIQTQNHFIYDFEKQDWKFWRADSYLYNTLGNITLQELVTIDEIGMMTRTRTASTYIEDEYVQVEENALFNSPTDEWFVTDKKFYYYTDLVAVDPELPADAEALVMYPNPATGSINFYITEETVVFVYAMNGQVVKTATVRPGQPLSLDALPAGAYQVRANTADTYYAGKLVKQ